MQSFTKTSEILGLFCSYFKHELFDKKAIAKVDMPLFLETWMDPSLELCMFFAPQLKTWTSTHLKSMRCYFDCALGYVYVDEKALKSSPQGANQPSLLDGDLENLMRRHCLRSSPNKRLKRRSC